MSRLLHRVLNHEKINLEDTDKIRSYLSGGHLVNKKEFRRMVSNLPGPQPEETLQYKFPNVAAEWDYERNYPLTPLDVAAGSNEPAHWICSAGHRWEAAIDSRAGGKRGCNKCLKRVATPEHNLATQFKHIADEWHPTLNGDLTPYDVTPKSNKNRFWLCKDCGHEWQATVYNGTKPNGTGCPECYKRRQHRKV